MGPCFLLLATRSGHSPDRIDAVAAREALPGMSLRRLAPRALLFLDVDAKIIDPGVPGAIAIGTMFSRDGTRIVADHGVANPEQLWRRLIAERWGAFLAIHVDETSGDICCLRDASSLFPVYVAEVDGMVAVTSDVRLLPAISGSALRVDWDGLARHLLCDVLRTARTGLVGVKELLPGQMLSLGEGAGAISDHWSPWAFCDSRLEDKQQAVDLVRAAALTSIGAWSACFRHIVLNLSGGLDSSIVAAGLGHAPTRVTALTLATRAARGDERLFARMVATHLGVELFEELESLSDVDLLRSDAGHLPRPLARSFAQWGNKVSVAVADQVNADAFFNGAGGDNVFCSMPSVSAVADRFLTDWTGIGTIGTARDMALMSGCGVLDVLIRGAKRAWRRERPYRWAVNRTFLDPRLFDLVPILFDHPWLQATPRKVLPGKSMHVAWLMGIQNHLEGFGRELARPVVSPLMSQPLVEACLRIPSWLWCDGGYNRAIAREAFVADLPAEILRRRSKGSPSSFLISLFEANRKLVGELLLGGLLMHHQLLDGDAIEGFLENGERAQTSAYARIMSLVDIEIWARSWAYRGLPNVAPVR